MHIKPGATGFEPSHRSVIVSPVMLSAILASGARLRLLITRLLTRLGFSETSFLILLALIIGIVAAAAAVGFHLLLVGIRDALYRGVGPGLYGPWLGLLVAFPAAGGLCVGLLGRYVFRDREGRGIVDVLEAVIRWRGVIRPLAAIEKILTSAITIGTGGSAGAEGPIVQIGAGVASGVGQLFRIARPQMPLLIACGAAAGISAIFNSPIGGVLFTLEVILLDFSLRSIGPLLMCSVVANVTTRFMLERIHGDQSYHAIFAMPPGETMAHAELSWALVFNFVILGLACGLLGVGFNRLMHAAEGWFSRLRFPDWARPALGGALLGIMGIIYVLVFGRALLGAAKPIDFEHYPLPAFYSDGYGVIEQLVRQGAVTGFYQQHSLGVALLLLGALLVAKLLGTAFTLGSGGSGGIIAPSLFLGACCGALVGLLLQSLGFRVQVSLCATVGMGAVLAAVVHAPLASILILLDLTHDHKVILPAMLACAVATGLARFIFPDSIYTVSLRARGVRSGTASDLSLLRRMTVEQVALEPATTLAADAPARRVIELLDGGGRYFVVTDERGGYAGVITAEEVSQALLRPEAIDLLVAADLTRPGVRPVLIADDLAGVLDRFTACDVDCLPVSVRAGSGVIIGLISRAALMRRYSAELGQSA